MAFGPLDELDAVSVRVRDPGRPEVFGAVGRSGLFRLDSSCGQARHRRVHVVDLNDEVAEAAGLDPPVVGVVNELQGHELVAGERQHRQAAQLCVGHRTDDVVPELLVELERTLEILHAQSDMQRPHPCRSTGCAADATTGKTRWVTRFPCTHSIGSPSGASSVFISPKKGRPWPMTTGTRSTATRSSSPSSRHCRAMVPAVTATVPSPAISCALATAASTPLVTKWNGASGWASTQSVGMR